MKNNTTVYVEDIMNQTEIDFEKAMQSQFRHPFLHWMDIRGVILKNYYTLLRIKILSFWNRLVS